MARLIAQLYPNCKMQIEARRSEMQMARTRSHAKLLHVRSLFSTLRFFSWNNLLLLLLLLLLLHGILCRDKSTSPHGQTRLQLTRPIKLDLHQRPPREKNVSPFSLMDLFAPTPSVRSCHANEPPSFRPLPFSPSVAPISGLHRLPTGLHDFLSFSLSLSLSLFFFFTTCQAAFYGSAN